jgi:HK97 family phage portal protein
VKWPWQREKRVWDPSWGDPSRIPLNSEGYGVEAGVYVTDLQAMQLVAVNACVRLLADSVAGLPLDAYRKTGNVRESVAPVPSLIASPFTDLTLFEGMWQLVACLALKGESVSIAMSRDRFEFVTSMLPIHPDSWTVDADRNGINRGRPVYRIDGERVPNEDVIHIRRFSLPGELHGLSPIAAARQGISLGLAAERFGARFFGDSANPSSVLETDQNLTDEQAKQTQKSWIDSHGGRRRPAMLSGGLKWRPISITPEESQFLATRSYQRDEIAMLFGIPPHMIGAVDKSTSWGTGIEQQGIGFVTYTLTNWLNPIEAAFSALLPRGQFARMNVNALLRGDMKARFDAYVSARNAGWLNVNEIRELEDRAPVPNGDDYIQPLNMGPLGSDPLAEKTPAVGGPPDA